jgi:ribonuclease HI
MADRKDGNNSPSSSDLGRNSHWAPPDGDCIKINTDASFIPETGEASIGLIARNSAGQFCFCAGRKIENIAEAEEAEAYAVLEGLQLASSLIKGPVTMESDCASVISTLQQRQSPNRSKFHVVYNAVNKLAASMSCCNFQFVKREGNLIAHELAWLARVDDLVGCWLNRPPEHIFFLLQSECKDYVNIMQ